MAESTRKRRQVTEVSGDNVSNIEPYDDLPLIQDMDEDEEDSIEALRTRRKQRELELTIMQPEPFNGNELSPAAAGNKMSEQSISISDQGNRSFKPGNFLSATPSRSQQESGKDPANQLNELPERRLNASIKERLRSRVRGIQSKITEKEGLPERKLRGLRELPTPSRFDDLKKEELEYDPQLKASIASAKEWRRMKMKKNIEHGIPTEEEAYSFFVGTGMTMEEEEEIKKDEKRSEEAPKDTIVELFNETTLTKWEKPLYIPNRDQLQKESVLFQYPSTIPALQENKVPNDVVPRSLEDEGFYVGEPPAVDATQLHVMENRILIAGKDDFSWFDENGLLKRLPDPVLEKPAKYGLLNDENLDPLLQTLWGKAEVNYLDRKYINGTMAGRRYQLDVDISTLSFTHHPLFSKEHVLVSRLQQLYNQYCAIVHRGLTNHLTGKLATLREALRQLQEATHGTKPKKRTSVLYDNEKRINHYKREIRQMRRQREEEEFRERMLLKNLFLCWKNVKQLREDQGYTNTPVALKILRQTMNKDEEEESMQKEIQEELQELREEHDEKFKEELASYEEKMLQWKKKMKQKKRRAQRRLEQTQGSPANQDQQQDEEPIAHPEPPPMFNEEESLIMIQEKMKKYRRMPGEAVLQPELQFGASVTPTENCNRQEQLRRTDMKKSTYFVKVMFNNKEVSRTTVKPLSTDFTIHFGEILNIQVLQWPESIKLQLFDATGWQNALVAEIFIPIPESSVVSGSVENEPFEFSSDHFISFKHAGVGSGVNIDLNVHHDAEPESPVSLLTSGILYSSVAWGIDQKGRVMAPPSKPYGRSTWQSSYKQRDALSALGAAGVVDMEMLISWINDSNLDPNDPTNTDVLNAARVMNNAQNFGASNSKFFRLNQLEDETDFATNEDLDNCKRFKLIQLRDRGIPEFKNLKHIPTSDKYVPDQIFQAYNVRLKGEEPVETEETSHRAKVANFLAEARKNVLARSQIAKRQLDLNDVVIEDEVPDIGTLGARLGQLFAKRHPLKPQRKERKRIGGQNLSAVKQVKILINIVRAFDVPIREETMQSGLVPVTDHPSSGASEFATSRQPSGMFSASTSGRALQTSYGSRMSSQQPRPQQSGYNSSRSKIESLVRPFVEVVFQGNFIRTSIADGPLPNWNEELIIPFRPPNNDYSTENLQTIKENIFINLFDEVVVDMLQDDRQRGTNIHQRTEKYWLGKIEIPFSTIYFNSKVKGLMRINSPPVLLGYKSSKTTHLSAGNQTSSTKFNTYLQLFVTIEPQLQPAQPIAEKFETNESETLVHNAQVWLAGCRSQYPSRQFKAMVSDLNGKKVFVTRYIRPQKPPDGLISDASLPASQIMKILARYVSLIPYIPDSVQFPDLCDIWTTSEQFLSMLAGDEEEHAILLCNFFLSIGKKAWVVLGNGIPEGATAYVMSLDGARYQLWNASTAECYDMQDVRCPLQSVGCLIDESNILANVQKEDHPSKIDLNFANNKMWKPFFSRSYPNPGLFSVQVEVPNYHRSDEQYFVNLQDKLERLLKNKLMEWRPRSATRWNRYCTQAFRNLLTHIEERFTTGASIANHNTELQEVISSYKLNGFPLQMPYTDMQHVFDAVFSTGVHNCEDPEVEFALALHIHTYPNSVVAVWVYIGRLVKKVSY